MNFAVISALNEADTIYDLVSQLWDAELEVVVVDNGSTDDTWELAAQAGAYVHVAEKPLGIGPAQRLGWQIALDLGATNIVQIDAGGSHLVHDAVRLLSVLQDGKYDLVIGSRFVDGATYDNSGGVWYRPMASRIMAGLCWLAQSGGRFADWTSGFRAMTAESARYLLGKHYFATMHGWQMECLAYANEAAMRIREVPITYIAGRSSMNLAAAHEASVSLLLILNHIGGRGRAKGFI